MLILDFLILRIMVACLKYWGILFSCIQSVSRGGKGIMAEVFITLQETKYIILILDIMIQ